jgi:hypothetical protein
MNNVIEHNKYMIPYFWNSELKKYSQNLYSNASKCTTYMCIYVTLCMPRSSTLSNKNQNNIPQELMCFPNHVSKMMLHWSRPSNLQFQQETTAEWVRKRSIILDDTPSWTGSTPTGGIAARTYCRRAKLSSKVLHIWHPYPPGLVIATTIFYKRGQHGII